MIEITYNADGLIPAVVQHAQTGEVLMLGYMNAEALAQTQASGRVTFWSRSRSRLWVKGETSGHFLQLVEIRIDCDADSLLVLAHPVGPTCHTGNTSCFYRNMDGADVAPMPEIGFLADLAALIAKRADERPVGAYTTKLLDGGVDRIGKKIGEEAAEVIIAAKNANVAELTWETADLLYHTMVLLQQQNVPLTAIWRELRRRHTDTA